ncbi:hypothetical protein J6590_012969 [Homalodisca vitripennis]|nr:hypothetical protein J6590_012969 [Homalodisca vitripennis]
MTWPWLRPEVPPTHRSRRERPATCQIRSLMISKTRQKAFHAEVPTYWISMAITSEYDITPRPAVTRDCTRANPHPPVAPEAECCGLSPGLSQLPSLSEAVRLYNHLINGRARASSLLARSSQIVSLQSYNKDFLVPKLARTVRTCAASESPTRALCQPSGPARVLSPVAVGLSRLQHYIINQLSRCHWPKMVL